MTNELHSSAGAYALDALDADEQAAFEKHLDECADCGAEVKGFLATTARIAEASGQAPSPALKTQVMRSIAHTVQERPVVTSLADRRKRRLLPRIALVAAGLLTALSIAGYVSERNQAGDLEAERAAVIKIMSSDDAAITKATMSNGGTAQLIASKENNKAVVVTDNLPKLKDGRVYQLWMITGDEPTSAGLIDAGSNIATMNGVDTVEQVALTVEPSGGSKSPTTKPIATLSAT